MNLQTKLQRLAEILGHDADEIDLYLKQYPTLSAISQLQLLSVAIRHQLDPLCDEISVMETPDGALPFITIDGWMKLINRHEQFAGMSLREHSEPSENRPAWVECSIYRHDRILPIVVREYLDEVKTEHGSWTQMPRRMLRHRAIQQCARLAFGIACVEQKPDNPKEGVSSVLGRTMSVISSEDDDQDSSNTPQAKRLSTPRAGELKHRLKIQSGHLSQ